MRACEGCRRRKIKCDSASSNQWPCAACTRLKLHCIPPTGGNDREFTGTGSLVDSEEPVEYNVSHAHGVNALAAQPQASHHYSSLPAVPSIETNAAYSRPSMPHPLNSVSYAFENLRQPYLAEHQASFPTSNPNVHESHPYYPPQPQSQIRHDSTTSTSDSDHTTAQELSEVLGELKILETGTGESDSHRR